MQIKVSSIIVFSFILLTVQSVLFYYIDQGILPRFILYFIYATAFIMPTVLLLKTKVIWTSYRFFYIIYLILLIILSIFNMNDDIGIVISMFAIYSQLISAFFFKDNQISF